MKEFVLVCTRFSSEVIDLLYFKVDIFVNESKSNYLQHIHLIKYDIRSGVTAGVTQVYIDNIFYIL